MCNCIEREIYSTQLAPVKKCTKCKMYLPATAEYFYKHKTGKFGLREPCKNCKRLIDKEYKILNKEKVRTVNKSWEKNNLEKIKANGKKWRDKNPDLLRVKDQRRRARKKSLPDTFTTEQFNKMKEYFNNKCLVCNSTTRLNWDHWIPLNNVNCPGTVETNMVLLCQSCNFSKGSKLPQQWLKDKFNNGYFTTYIYLKVHNYFKSLK